LNGVRVKFYLVPFNENHVSSFLARYDGWYNRHIYSVFRSQPFTLPWVDLKKGDEAKGADLNRVSTEPPGIFLRNTVECYTREANVACNIHVYKMAGWYGDAKRPGPKDVGKDSTNKCDVLIPFIQQIELGLAPYIVEFRERNKISADSVKGRPQEDWFREKGFAFNPAEVTMKFAKMDLAGNKSGTLVDEPVPYENLVVANIPRKDHACFPPDPTQPFLEMYAKPSRTYQPKEGRRNVLLSDPKQHIYAVTISARPGLTFSVLCDGVKFGPFSKIKISPIKETGTAGKPFMLPIQTFFPLDM